MFSASIYLVPYPEQLRNPVFQTCAIRPHTHAPGQLSLPYPAAPSYRVQVHIRPFPTQHGRQSLLLNRTVPLIHNARPPPTLTLPTPRARLSPKPSCVPASNWPINSRLCLELFLMRLNFIYKKKGQKSIK